MKNVFICGLSGSGKDTLAKHFDANGFNNMRLAETIKRIICEKEGLTFEELEELKRTDARLRKMHNDVADELGHGAHMTRLNQIINKTAMDFQWFSESEKSKPTCVFDVRADYEIETLLDAGFIGIFLSRTTAEYRQTSHYTEQNMFQNGKLTEYIENFPNQCVVVFNDATSSVISKYAELSEKYPQAIFVAAANDGTEDFKNRCIPYIEYAFLCLNDKPLFGINIHKGSDSEPKKNPNWPLFAGIEIAQPVKFIFVDETTVVDDGNDNICGLPITDKGPCGIDAQVAVAVDDKLLDYKFDFNWGSLSGAEFADTEKLLAEKLLKSGIIEAIRYLKLFNIELIGIDPERKQFLINYAPKVDDCVSSNLESSPFGFTEEEISQNDELRKSEFNV